LKSLIDPTKNVAKGVIRSIHPNKEVGGKRLGPYWCEVQISAPIQWDSELIRPYSNLSTVGDAIGVSVAWPRHLVNIQSKASYTIFFNMLGNFCAFVSDRILCQCF
jgi:TNP1/EN/SPM transposase